MRFYSNMNKYVSENILNQFIDNLKNNQDIADYEKTLRECLELREKLANVNTEDVFIIKYPQSEQCFYNLINFDMLAENDIYVCVSETVDRYAKCHNVEIFIKNDSELFPAQTFKFQSYRFTALTFKEVCLAKNNPHFFYNDKKFYGEKLFYSENLIKDKGTKNNLIRVNYDYVGETVKEYLPIIQFSY